MRRMAPLTGLLVAFLLVLEAGAAPLCTPLPPKEWAGTIKGSVRGTVTMAFFEDAGCEWHGAEDIVNGLDGYVIEVEEYAGLPVTVEPNSASLPMPSNVWGMFLNKECERAGFWGSTASGPQTATIPLAAKWMVINADQAMQMDLEITSPGRICEKTKKKKKKKKRG